MPISSLPSPYGIGTFGKAAYDFADFLHAAGQGYWQLLPLGPTSYGDSPYQSFSTFAGNPYFIDLDLLIKDKLLTRKEVTSCAWGSEPRYVDYGKIYESRFALLERAKARGWERDREAVAAFESENSRWLPDYALFMALKRHFGMKSWTEWPDEGARLHKTDALERYRAELRGDVELFTYIQFLFFRQWSALKSYINGLGIRIIGDIPIYVAMDSSDVWSEPEKFQLDERNVPVEVSGVPPDYFSADGQLWGNPLYDYEAMQKDGFEWWIRRIGGAAKLYDVIRIDHFRGFELLGRALWRDDRKKRPLGQGPRHGACRRADRLVPRHRVHRRGSRLSHARGHAAACRLASARHEGAGIRLRLARHEQLSAAQLRGELHLLHRHARQRAPRPLAHGGG